MRGQRRPQDRQLLVALSRRKPLAASSMAAPVQRNTILASRQRLTLRQTCRMVPFMFSMTLVHASERHSSIGPSMRGVAEEAPGAYPIRTWQP